jgi:hypothetical protein
VSDEAKALLEKLGASLTDDAMPRRQLFRNVGVGAGEAARAKPEPS